MLDKNTAIKKMNLYGKQRKPFLFLIDFQMQNCVVQPINEVNPQEILFSINSLSNFSPTLPEATSKEIIFEKMPISYANYLSKFENIIKHIRLGDSYLINLTCSTPITINLTLHEIFYLSTAKYRLWFKEEFVCFSPETFIQIIDNQIISCPMKGTIDADIPQAETLIMNDLKEKAEHNTIVDLIRNDLSMVAEKVKVEKFRYIDKIKTHDKTLLQVSSRIVGNLAPNFHESIGDVLFRLLPAGSISGAPKKKTLEIILATENYERGFYTGVFGIFDGQNLDCGVLIRFIEQTKNGLIFKSGGGVTSKSNPQVEYQEMIDKVYVPIIRKY
jgi:para-aminobenzoate synthetase component 1